MYICSLFDRKDYHKKNILKWKRTNNVGNKPIDLGDANSPDAPWMKDDK